MPVFSRILFVTLSSLALSAVPFASGQVLSVDPTQAAGIQQSAAQQGALIDAQQRNAEAILEQQKFNTDFLNQYAALQNSYVQNAKQIAEVGDLQQQQLQESLQQNQVLNSAQAQLKQLFAKSSQQQLDSLRVAEQGSIISTQPGSLTMPLLQFVNPWQTQANPQLTQQNHGLGQFFPQFNGNNGLPQQYVGGQGFNVLQPVYQPGQYNPNAMSANPQVLFAVPQGAGNTQTPMTSYQPNPMSVGVAQPNFVSSTPQPGSAASLAASAPSAEVLALRAQVASLQNSAPIALASNVRPIATTSSTRRANSMNTLLGGVPGIFSSIDADEQSQEESSEESTQEADLDSVETEQQAPVEHPHDNTYDVDSNVPVIVNDPTAPCPDGPHAHVEVKIVRSARFHRLKRLMRELFF
jgi:hypothetical protein